jgi:hypothetical protein
MLPVQRVSVRVLFIAQIMARINFSKTRLGKMRNDHFIRFALFALFVLGTYSLAATSTFTGILSDNMCGRKHTMMMGRPDSECVRACIKARSRPALLVGNRVCTLEDNSREVDKFAGQRVIASGVLAKDNIHLQTIGPVKLTESIELQSDSLPATWSV